MNQESSEDQEIAISEDFDDLTFGIKNDIVAYGRTKTVFSLVPKSPSIAALICGVKKMSCVSFDNAYLSPLPNHIVGWDALSRKVFIRTEVTQKNLDQGAELKNQKSLVFVRLSSLHEDTPFQLIPTKLGGHDSPINAFPLNPNTITTEWETANQKVYDHVSRGEEHVARLIYVMVYGYEKEDYQSDRPAQIWYNFKLYTHGTLVGKQIEGKVVNSLLKTK